MVSPVIPALIGIGAGIGMSELAGRRGQMGQPTQAQDAIRRRREKEQAQIMERYRKAEEDWYAQEAEERKQEAIDDRIRMILSGTGVVGGQPQEQPQPVQAQAPGPQAKPGVVTDAPIRSNKDIFSPQNQPIYMKGMSMDESGNVNFQFARDESQVGPAWLDVHRQVLGQMQANNPNVPPIKLETDALMRAIQITKTLPPREILNYLSPERSEEIAEQVFWSAVFHKLNDPATRRSLQIMARRDKTNLGEGGLDNAATLEALRAVAEEMGGWAPEDVRERVIGLRNIPISDKQMRMALKMYQVTDPSQISDTMLQEIDDELKKRKLQQTYDEAMMRSMASEEAQQIIHRREFGGEFAGPTQREVEKEKRIAKEKPIEPERRAEAGIPPEFETYYDIVEGGKRLLNDQDKKAWDKIKQVLRVISQLKANAQVVFTSGPDVISRLQHGATLKWEKAAGSQTGQALQRYEDKTETMTRLLLELVGESGGRFTDKDVKQIMKTVPEIEGLVGDFIEVLPEGKDVAQSKFKDLDALLGEKLQFIKSPQMIDVKGQKPKFKITKDKKLVQE